MYIEIYFLMQLIILITLIVLYRKDYIAPEVIYSASMVLSSFSYIQLKDYWGRDISKETFEVCWHLHAYLYLLLWFHGSFLKRQAIIV